MDSLEQKCDKIAEQYMDTRDCKPNKLPESIMQEDEDVEILMHFNNNEKETNFKVIKKVGFSLGDTEEYHHNVKVKFVPPFVPKKQHY